MSLGQRSTISGAIFSVFLIIMSPISSVAQDTLSLTEMVTALTAKGFDEKAAAVEALGEVGEDQVELILEGFLEEFHGTCNSV